MKNIIKVPTENIAEFAKLIAELTRNEIVFTARMWDGEWQITITGY